MIDGHRASDDIPSGQRIYTVSRKGGGNDSNWI